MQLHFVECVFDLELDAYKREGVKNREGKEMTDKDFNFKKNDPTVDLLMQDGRDKSVLEVREYEILEYSNIC